MKCPLLHTTYVYPSGGKELELSDCIKEDCAWWDEKKGQCCIKTLSQLEINGGINTHPY